MNTACSICLLCVKKMVSGRIEFLLSIILAAQKEMTKNKKYTAISVWPDWIAKRARIFHPMRGKTKTNRNLTCCRALSSLKYRDFVRRGGAKNKGRGGKGREGRYPFLLIFSPPPLPQKPVQHFPGLDAGSTSDCSIALFAFVMIGRVIFVLRH